MIPQYFCKTSSRQPTVFRRTFDEQYFESSTLLQDAVSRNLEVIGEAAKKLPGEIRQSIDTVEWRKIAGMRDIIAHEYFGLDLNIVWDACTRKIPELSGQIRSWLEAQ